MNIQTINKTKLSEILKKVAEALDITDKQYEEAEKHYKAVANFLANCPRIAPFSPDMYPQGSFRLGTVVRPLLEDDEYDIDLVCQLSASHNEFTQYGLKNLIGERLKEPMYRDKLQPENRRSWTLKYAEETKFHLDILPAIPDTDSISYLRGLESYRSFSDTAISITDNKRKDYYNYSRDWPKSNPIAYAEWFKDQMKFVLTDSLRTYAGLKGVSIDEVPQHKVKTPLQRAIQILKRHRDLLFGKDEDKPISIIITTLSARAYGNQGNVYDALLSILRDMDTYITQDTEGNDEVVNPVDPRENFADKWIQYPKRRANFYSWLERARMDFETLLDISSYQELKGNLQKSLGESVVNKGFQQATLLPVAISGIPVVRNPQAIDYSPHEEFIEERFPVNIQYKLKINCRVQQDGFRERLLRDLLKEVYILRRNHSLTFYIERNDVPGPYKVFWKVRNRGVKAKLHGVRGQIVPDAGNETKVERSSFYGPHFVECYIVKNDVCVARARMDVPISGILN
ncbi:MAG: nucleotidyltransferase [Flavobacterium sp.]|nr:MAG: nucleotidyltransferase [Flavobacterium sp.]